MLKPRPVLSLDSRPLRRDIEVLDAIILPGVAIGDDAVIGAGSVVTCDVPAGVTAAGNPTRVRT